MDLPTCSRPPKRQSVPRAMRSAQSQVTGSGGMVLAEVIERVRREPLRNGSGGRGDAIVTSVQVERGRANMWNSTRCARERRSGQTRSASQMSLLHFRPGVAPNLVDERLVLRLPRRDLSL